MGTDEGDGGMSAPRWLRHPTRAFLDWLGGLIVDRVFAREAELRRIAVYNETHPEETP